MSGWTITQLLAIPVDEVPIQEPIEGTVKVSMPVKTHEKYGDSQFLVIEDGTGEIAVDYKAPKPETKLVPIEKGEKVRIQAQEYKGKLTGAKKEMYSGKDGRKPKITVYGNRLTNLSREIASAPVQTPQGVTSPAGLLPPPISEQEAVETYWRVFERQAAKLSRFMECEDFEGFMRQADLGDVQLCHTATAEVFRGILAGRVTPDTRREPPKPQAQQQSQPRQDDPFEGLDDDIPFLFFLPLLLPLLYFAAIGGIA